MSIRDWGAFLLGVLLCVLALTYGELRKETSGFLAMEVHTTSPGMLKVLYTKDGVLVDPGWIINFPQGNMKKLASFPLSPGAYELIGFKPLVEAGGEVTVSNLKIISGIGVNEVSLEGFVAINQLAVSGAKKIEAIFGPIAGANDPFGVVPGLQQLVSRSPFAFNSYFWLVAGKLSLIAVFVALMFGLSGSFPFTTRVTNHPRPEPGAPQWLGLLAVGLIVLFLRNAHSLLVPVLYTEDGSWSSGLINRGFWDMLFNAKGGHSRYFVFGNILLLYFAQLANTALFGNNLTYLPHFISFFSLLFYSVLAAAPVFLLRDVLRLETRLLLWLLVLLVPLGDSSFEILGRLSNIGFAFLFLALCLLLWRSYTLHDDDKKKVIFADAMLFLCANTNPLCYPLIAIFLLIDTFTNYSKANITSFKGCIRSLVVRFKNKSAVTLVAVLFVMGVLMLVREKGVDSFLTGETAYRNLIEMSLARVLLFPFIFPYYSYFSNIFAVCLGALFIFIVILSLMHTRKERSVIVWTSMALLFGTTMTIITRPGLTQLFTPYKTTALDRYYFGLTFLVFLLIVSLISICFNYAYNKWIRFCSNAVVGCLIAYYVGNVNYMFEFDKPRWSDRPAISLHVNVENAYSHFGETGPDGVRYQVRLHPDPWVTHFPQNYILATVLGIRSVSFIGDSIEYSDHQVGVEKMTIYEGKIVRQTPAARGRDDGWFYVSGGSRFWIPNDEWLKSKNISPSDVVTISSQEFLSIPDSGRSVN